jgi:hypothetical protein
MNKKQQVMMSGGGGGVKTLAGNNERRRKSHPNSQQLPGIISSPPPSSSSPMHHTEEALREIHGTASLLVMLQILLTVVCVKTLERPTCKRLMKISTKPIVILYPSFLSFSSSNWRQMQQMKNCWLEQFGCSGFTGVCGSNHGKFGL